MSGIERIVCDDFTGGQVPRLAATDFSERQWASIRGLVLEDPTRLRSQWSCQRIGLEDGFDELAHVAGRVVARKPDGTFWWMPYVMSNLTYDETRALTWTQVPGIADPNLHIICQVPYRDEGASAGFVEGLLLNGRERAGDAYVLVPSGSSLDVEAFAKWPGDGRFIPPADEGAMWADFLVLGNVRWLVDEDAGLSDANNRPHPSLLWFSSPTDIGEWDVLDVQPVTFYNNTGATRNLDVRGIHQIDAGLFVTTHSGAALLRGTADDYDFEPLRPNAGSQPRPYGALAWWSRIGAVCWVDTGGRLWSTNGEEFAHLNEGTNIEPTRDFATYLEGWFESLIVAHADGRLLWLRSLETEGVWGELVAPTSGAVKALAANSEQLYLVDADGAVWRYNRANAVRSERGMIDGVPVELRVATRTVERRGGHEKTVWHRVGLRGKGPGTVAAVTVRPGPALDASQPELVHELDASIEPRHDVVVRAHGPSKEVSAEVTFEGDVEVEQVAFWLHAGRPAR